MPWRRRRHLRLERPKFYLKRFPVDVIKIDRSIVEGLGHDRSDSAIVSATITLAHALGLEVIPRLQIPARATTGGPYSPPARRRHS